MGMDSQAGNARLCGAARSGHSMSGERAWRHSVAVAAAIVCATAGAAPSWGGLAAEFSPTRHVEGSCVAGAPLRVRVEVAVDRVPPQAMVMERYPRDWRFVTANLTPAFVGVDDKTGELVVSWFLAGQNVAQWLPRLEYTVTPPAGAAGPVEVRGTVAAGYPPKVVEAPVGGVTALTCRDVVTARRTLPASWTAGAKTVVAIAWQVDDAVARVEVQETIPPGWVAVDAEPPATFHADRGVLVWALKGDEIDPEGLRYTVVPSATGTPGSATFNGEALFATVDQREGHVPIRDEAVSASVKTARDAITPAATAGATPGAEALP